MCVCVSILLNNMRASCDGVWAAAEALEYLSRAVAVAPNYAGDSDGRRRDSACVASDMNVALLPGSQKVCNMQAFWALFRTFGLYLT